MKITLNSNNEIHRKIGLMYGVSSIQTQEAWMFYKIKDEWSYSTPKSITIDLDTAEPDLRMAIGSGIITNRGKIFNILDYGGNNLEYNTKDYQSNNPRDFRLSREWLESQGVEVSE